MKSRCNNENCINYKDYGGRGIKLYDEWNEWIKFKTWALNNGYSDELSIDRIDTNGNYEPNNCRWANRFQQARNKRNNVLITINNETKTLKEWCIIGNVNYKSAHTQISRHGIESFNEWYLNRLITNMEGKEC